MISLAHWSQFLISTPKGGNCRFEITEQFEIAFLWSRQFVSVDFWRQAIRARVLIGTWYLSADESRVSVALDFLQCNA